MTKAPIYVNNITLAINDMFRIDFGDRPNPGAEINISGSFCMHIEFAVQFRNMIDDALANHARSIAFAEMPTGQSKPS